MSAALALVSPSDPAPGAWRPAPVQGQLRLAELLGALSHALDMTEGQPPGHCVRCCWIGVHVGEAFGFSAEELSDLYYTLLLKDLGCSSNAARLCQLYLTDDISLKRDFKLVGDGLPQVLRFVLAHTGLESGMADRFRALANIVQNGGQLAREVVETRCVRGADIARQMRFSESVAGGIRDLDEHWDGRGRPTGLVGPAISPFAQIALLAQVADVFHASRGVEAARREIASRSGTWFDPRLVAAFDAVASRPDLWAKLASPDLEATVFSLPPAQRSQALDDDYMDDIAHAFAGVIDAKTPFTNGHSTRVAQYTDLLAGEIGMEAGRRRRLTRAALLHDIGKLGVSNSVLDKPGKLDEEEWKKMRGHSSLGETILSRIGAFGELATIAGTHHERLDGKGYPRGIGDRDLDLETRIVTTADIFDALTADRPYRSAMPLSQAMGIMEGDLGKAIDPSCFDALKAVVAQTR